MTIFNLFKFAKDFRTLQAGETVFTAGNLGDWMYVVIEGQVDVTFPDQSVDTVSEGGIVGEMALIDSEPRSATAVAKTACKLAPIDQKRFTHLVQTTPYFALEVMHVMAERLRRQRARS
jgi:CRP-like cAMP-binding protein